VVAAADEGLQTMDGPDPGLEQRLADGREADEVRDIDVIVADDGQVLGTRNSRMAAASSTPIASVSLAAMIAVGGNGPSRRRRVDARAPARLCSPRAMRASGSSMPASRSVRTTPRSRSRVDENPKPGSGTSR
jgi:hypothetical protein